MRANHPNRKIEIHETRFQAVSQGKNQAENIGCFLAVYFVLVGARSTDR
jgi:hypothetical protein